MLDCFNKWWKRILNALQDYDFRFFIILFGIFGGWLLIQILDSDVGIKAAWIQGLLGVIAGLFVLWAGYLAYWSATYAIRIQEKKETLRKLSYRIMMKKEVIAIIKKMESRLLDENGKRGNLHETEIGEFDTFEIPDELKTKNWENWSMLEPTEISNLHGAIKLIEINNIVSKYNKAEDALNFCKNAHERNKAEERLASIYSSARVLDLSLQSYRDNMKEYLKLLNELEKSLGVFIELCQASSS